MMSPIQPHERLLEPLCSKQSPPDRGKIKINKKSIKKLRENGIQPVALRLQRQHCIGE
jgi:hypothetical protein